MFKKAFHLIFTLCGMLLGLGVSQTLINRFAGEVLSQDSLTVWVVNGSAIFLFGIIFYSIYSALGDRDVFGESGIFPRLLQSVPIEELVPGIIFCVIGLLVAGAISSILMNIHFLSSMYLNIVISVLLYIGLGYYGWMTGKFLSRSYREKLIGFFSSDNLRRRSKSRSGAFPKVFDTSVIIDGRIQEILKTGFIEGDIIIPDFVMVELRHISDSADELKRNRGRRGLDILKAIQDERGIRIYDTSSNKELKRIPEVDVKLLKLAESLGGVVVTNDYNLNKVAAVEGIGVLNINELANTLKPVVLPGEVMTVIPVKEGKTEDQSVAYLDDGTMIVVQGGRGYIGKRITVSVTSVIQTAAGRMIFVKV